MRVEVPYAPLPIDQSDVHYRHGSDSERRTEVPPGRTLEFEYRSSTTYPGTTRKHWIHIPVACSTAQPSAVVVFLDGWWNLDPTGEVRGGIVLDNLVHAGDLPPTIGMFIDPGVLTSTGAKNRNIEYDAYDDRLASFVLDEIVPAAQALLPLSSDPGQWAICGGSSGGSAAFTAAWFRPDRFGKVVGFLSSFAQMPGGNPYPKAIGSSPRRPLRVFLQAGHRDLNWDEPEMNWLASNLEVAASLARAGYDFRLVLGDGAHHPNHAGALLPDALRWQWRE